MTSHSKTSDSITGEKRRISSKAIFALVFYVIMPIFSITMIIITYPQLSKERLLGILQRTVPIGGLLIIVSQYQVRYEKGDLGRFILNEIYVILVVLWIFALLGGQPVIHQTWEEYHFSLNIWNYVIVILIVTSMNFLYYILEYQAYRKREVEIKSKDIDSGEVDGQASQHKGVTIITVPWE
jgi:hypothetical protein